MTNSATKANTLRNKITLFWRNIEKVISLQKGKTNLGLSEFYSIPKTKRIKVKEKTHEKNLLFF